MQRRELIALLGGAAAARAMGLQVQVFNASTGREIDAAFATLVSERPDALFVGAGPFWIDRRVQRLDPADMQSGGIHRQRMGFAT